jgi:hypothetical protein
MATNWTLSAALERELALRLERFEANYGPIGYRVYPSVMWSLGGQAYKPSDADRTRVALPAEYSTGFYRSEPPPKGNGLLLIPSRPFGFVAFLPKADDLESGLRLIDYDGERIVVR